MVTEITSLIWTIHINNNNSDFATTLYYKGNQDITWETSHSFNTGFDFAFGKEN